MKGLIFLRRCVWELPQNILAWFVMLYVYFTKQFVRYDHHGISTVVRHKGRWGVGLGMLSFVPDITAFAPDERTNAIGKYLEIVILHERDGHGAQSAMLGPFYLLVIGLPSSIGNLLRRVFVFDYYKQPWEAWADKLAGIIR